MARRPGGIVLSSHIVRNPNMQGPLGRLAILLLSSTLCARQIEVSAAAPLQQAMAAAVAGDTILVAPGAYTGDVAQSGDPGNLPNGTGYFWIGNDGSALDPIVVVAKDSADPPVLQGSTINSGYVVHVTGDHVILKNLILQTGDKVVVFDNASHGLIEDCELRNSGNEILHIRDSSSDVVIHRSSLHNSGNVAPNYGEGIYVGTDQARWGADDVPQTGAVAPWWGDKAISEGYGGYDWRVHGTKVLCSYFFDIASEPMDIKEGTMYTEVTGNVFLGDSTGRKGGSTYFSYVGSFIDQKGVKGTFRDNVFYAGTNDSLVDFIPEVRRSFAHVPTDLTPTAYSKPWCDAKISIDSNLCLAVDNVVATQVPADPRSACPEARFNFHSPSFPATATTPRTSIKASNRKSYLALDRDFRNLEIVGPAGTMRSPTGRSLGH